MRRLLRGVLGVLLLAVIGLQTNATPAYSMPALADRLDPRPDISLKTLTMGDLVARGHLPTIDIWFTGYGDYELAAEGSYLQLVFDHSELVRPQDSTLTVLLNDAPVASTFLTPENVKRTTWKIPLPTDKLKRDLNHIQLKYYMRIRDDDCVNQENPGLWSNIYEATHIHYQYASPLKFIALPPPDLGRLPDPFLRAWLADGQIAVVLPDVVTSDDLSAAASVAARFGQMATGKTLKASLHFASRFERQQRMARDVVVIGQPGANALLDELLPALPLKFQKTGAEAHYIDASGKPIALDTGVLQQLVSPWDDRCSVLVLSGGNNEGVQRAVRTLSSRLAAKNLQGPYAVITKADEELRKGETPTENTSQVVITLEKLGFVDGLSAKGIGVHPITFTIDAPPIDPQAGAYFDMRLTYSPLLDPILSSITLALNGTSVRTLALDREGSQEVKHRVALPPGSLRPGANTVTITFGHHLRGSDWFCMPLAEERAWAHLLPDSAFVLPVGPEPTTLDLAYFPYPFVRNGTPAGTYLVMPEEPALLEDSLQVAVALGRQSVGSSTEMRAGMESHLNDEVRRNHHLIVYGAPPNSATIAQIGPSLPLSLEEDSHRSLQRSESVLLGIKDAANLGVIELIPSPWNGDNKALLLVSGTSSQTAKRSPPVLGGKLPAGNVALVATDDKGDPKVVGIKMVAKTERSAVEREAERQRRLFLLATIPAALLAMGMVGFMVVRTAR